MLSVQYLKELLLKDLEVDRSSDDVTTRLLGSKLENPANVVVRAKSPGVFCGELVLEALQSIFPDDIKNLEVSEDGREVKAGDIVLSFYTTVGKALTLERTILNTITHVSGIATTTRKFVDAVRPFPTKILATRKTLPGIRDLQLMGVVAGGGFVHRRNLSDGILIKDNHVAMGGIENLLTKANDFRSPLHKIEIEVQDIRQLDEALKFGADVIMLDNFDLPMLKEGIALIRSNPNKNIKIEVSGGITLETIRPIAELGVDYISVGMLTHSVTALNMSLDI